MHLIVWLTQLGLSVAAPLAGFLWLAVWLKNRYDLGLWVVLVGIGLGMFFAIDGFVRNLKVLNSLSKDKEKKEPPVSFGEHD